VLHATATTPWGNVRVFVTHLTDGDAEINRRQADALRAYVEATGGSISVVAGDFNAQEDSPQIRVFAQVWEDTYRAANPHETGLTCCIDDLTQGPTEALEKRIDYIFLVSGGGARVVSAERVLARPFQMAGGWLWASDHVGLLATIEGGASGSTSGN